MNYFIRTQLSLQHSSHSQAETLVERIKAIVGEDPVDSFEFSSDRCDGPLLKRARVDDEAPDVGDNCCACRNLVPNFSSSAKLINQPRQCKLLCRLWG